MAFGKFSTHISEVTVEPQERTQSQSFSQRQNGFLGRLGNDLFKNDCLDRKLKRHQITGMSYCKL